MCQTVVSLYYVRLCTPSIRQTSLPPRFQFGYVRPVESQSPWTTSWACIRRRRPRIVTCAVRSREKYIAVMRCWGNWWVEKQLKKRQFSLLKAKTMRLRSTENLIKTAPMDDIESVHSISYASSPITSAASTDDTEVSRFDNMCQSITFTCIPHSRWLVCVINDAVDVPLARLVKKPVIWLYPMYL